MKRVLRAYGELLRLVRRLPADSRPYYAKYTRENIVNFRDVEANELDELFNRIYVHAVWVLNKIGNNTTTTTCGDDDDYEDEDLPIFSEDVLIRILVWLPVISLLRFKSVCKSWCALIQTPYFIDFHTTTTFNSSSSTKFGSFILHASKKMFMLSSSRSESRCDDEKEDIIDNDQADSLGSLPCWESGSLPCYVDSLYARLNMHMVGSCNGLICIHESEGEYEAAVYLWNPATRQFRILPKPPIITITIEEKVAVMLPDFFAFGFDIKTKDYKVVMFKCFRTPAAAPAHIYFTRILVYSLSTNTWRVLEGIHNLPAVPYDLPSKNQGIYMNGCYFFVGKDESQVWLRGGGKAVVCNNSLVYSFDFTKEILTTMQVPDHDSEHDLILSCWGADKIALFIIQRNLAFGGSDNGLDYEYYHIWLLNEQPSSSSSNSNKESWTKVHSFRKINKLKHPTQPRCISNNGEFALISTTTPRRASELQLFNLVTKEAAKKDFPFDVGIKRAHVYTQTLVSI